MEPRVIFEDEYLLVIDKPAGMVVNRAESVKGGTVQDWVEKYLNLTNPTNLTNTPNDDFVKRSGVVHRLDKETSGLLLVARTPQAFFNLQRQFKNRRIKKKYISLVHGILKNDQGSIKSDLGRLPWNRERFGVLEEGRNAETKYTVLKRLDSKVAEEVKRKFPGRDYGLTLLELSPKTGRTHQIRVHLKSIGHPVVSDEFYAGRKTARDDRKWCPRLFLHAAGIVFDHPILGRKVNLSSDPPADLIAVLTEVGLDVTM